MVEARLVCGKSADDVALVKDFITSANCPDTFVSLHNIKGGNRLKRLCPSGLKDNARKAPQEILRRGEITLESPEYFVANLAKLSSWHYYQILCEACLATVLKCRDCQKKSMIFEVIY